MVGWREADQRVDLRRAAEVLQVVARHHPALGVPDDVDLGGAGGAEHRSTKLDSCCGGVLNRARAIDAEGAAAVVGAVVEREHAVAIVEQQGRKRLPVAGHVLEGAVHEDDRARMRRGRLARPVVGPGRARARARVRIAVDAVVDHRQRSWRGRRRRRPVARLSAPASNIPKSRRRIKTPLSSARSRSTPPGNYPLRRLALLVAGHAAIRYRRAQRPRRPGKGSTIAANPDRRRKRSDLMAETDVATSGIDEARVRDLFATFNDREAFFADPRGHLDRPAALPRVRSGSRDELP